MVKLHNRVPLVTREGTEVQLKEALSRKRGAILKLDDHNRGNSGVRSCDATSTLLKGIPLWRDRSDLNLLVPSIT